MFAPKSIPADHKDLIHDVAYDFHGRRMATCSSDQSVKVWDLNENGEWHCTADWKTHCGSVWRVTWSHPEFGQILATCSFDRTAVIWEEVIGESNTREGQAQKGQPQRGQTHWVKKASFVDSRTSVTDVKFAPKHLGLMVATCSADGIIRVYEAPDVMNLTQWTLQNDINCKINCSCISWNPSRIHPPMLAVGSDDPNPSAGGKVQIYEYNDNTRKWSKIETLNSVGQAVHDLCFAANLGRSYHLLAVASKDLHIIQMTPYHRDAPASGPAPSASTTTRLDIKPVAQFDHHKSQVWRLSWNVTGTVLASCGDDGVVRLWQANYMNNWKCISQLKGGSGDQAGNPPVAAATGHAHYRGQPAQQQQGGDAGQQGGVIGRLKYGRPTGTLSNGGGAW